MTSRLVVTLSVAALGAALCPALAQAQARRGMREGSPQRGATITMGSGRGGGRNGRTGFGHPGHGHDHDYDRPAYVPYGPYLYPYDGYVGRVAPQKQPPARVVIVKPRPAPAPPAPPVESLLLEYQNGQWVRVPTGNKTPMGPLAMQPKSYRRATARKRASAAKTTIAQPAREMRKAVLVFRDGRKIQVRKYFIQGAFIYVSQDYWSTGSWTRKIPISELNVPATLKLNRERGVKFDLPSGPDEVVVGF